MNTYIPSWIALSMPPIVIIVLIVNLIMAFVGSLLIVFSNKQLDYTSITKQIIKKTIKLFLISVLTELITVVLYLLPEIFKSNSALETFLTNLKTNPYTNVYAFIYIVIIILINITVIYLLTRKQVENKIYKMCMIILLFPYIYLLPSTMIVKKEFNTLEDYKHTTIANSNKIKKIIHELDMSDHVTSFLNQTNNYPYKIVIYVDSLDFDYQLSFEKNASILMNLVNETEEIVFVCDNKEYKYTLDNINNIFKDVKKIKLEDIEKRYKDKNFEEYPYFGRIKEYDVFDTSAYCELENQFLFEYEGINYYLSCTKLEEVLLYGNNQNINIKDALEKNLISYEDVINSSIKLIEK